MKPAIPVQAPRAQSVIVNLGGPGGLADPSAGVFIDGVRLQGVVAVTVTANAEAGAGVESGPERQLVVTIRPGGPVQVIGHADRVEVTKAAPP